MSTEWMRVDIGMSLAFDDRDRDRNRGRDRLSGELRLALAETADGG